MTARTTPADVEVAARDIRFNVAEGGGTYWLNGDPVGTAVFNALSLTFPDGERLFMDAVRNYRSKVSGKLLEDVRGFIAQEAIHSREHHGLNLLIDRTRYTAAADIEAEVRRRTQFSRSRGPAAMLLSTICLEHFTAMMAEVFMDKPDLFKGSDPEIERMWRWHALEETEHKAVAFDVFMTAMADWPPWRRYLRRTIIMAIVTILFSRNIVRFAGRLLEADGYTRRAARKAASRYVWGEPGIFRRGWRTYFAWYRPGFHPWDQDNRAELARWQAEFDEASVAA